jgi:hypothetical protein
MRVAVVVALGFGLGLLSGCASEKLALAPPAGVDFSGHWRLNEAESDDPMRLVQSQVDPSRVGGPGEQGGQGGQGRQGRGRGGPGGGGMGGLGNGVGGPVMPGVGALGEGLRWPGKEIEIKQVAGVVALSSGGLNQVYQPSSADRKPHRHKHPSDGEHGRDDGGPGGSGPGGGGPGGAGGPRGAGGRDRDMPERDRGEGAPAVCGWDDKTLVVQGGDAEDERPPFEERYSISEDGQRLVEVVGFKGGRSGGFTMSRTWDRVVP